MCLDAQQSLDRSFHKDPILSFAGLGYILLAGGQGFRVLGPQEFGMIMIRCWCIHYPSQPGVGTAWVPHRFGPSVVSIVIVVCLY